jgi:hypothetical protein
VGEHSSKVDRARQMEKKMTESFRKRVQATPGITTAEEEDIKLQGFKESVNELLSAVLSTVEDNPELKGKVRLRVIACCVPTATTRAHPPADLARRCWTRWVRRASPRRPGRSVPMSASTAAMPAASSRQDLKGRIEVVRVPFFARRLQRAVGLMLTQAALVTELEGSNGQLSSEARSHHARCGNNKTASDSCFAVLWVAAHKQCDGKRESLFRLLSGRYRKAQRGCHLLEHMRHVIMPGKRNASAHEAALVFQTIHLGDGLRMRRHKHRGQQLPGHGHLALDCVAEEKPAHVEPSVWKRRRLNECSDGLLLCVALNADKQSDHNLLAQGLNNEVQERRQKLHRMLAPTEQQQRVVGRKQQAGSFFCCDPLRSGFQRSGGRASPFDKEKVGDHYGSGYHR